MLQYKWQNQILHSLTPVLPGFAFFRSDLDKLLTGI